jgi:hypothetical protein
VHECGNELSPSARKHDKISQGCRIGEEALRELSENSFIYDCYRETSFQGATTVFPEDQWEEYVIFSHLTSIATAVFV